MSSIWIKLSQNRRKSPAVPLCVRLLSLVFSYTIKIIPRHMQLICCLDIGPTRNRFYRDDECFVWKWIQMRTHFSFYVYLLLSHPKRIREEEKNTHKKNEMRFSDKSFGYTISFWLEFGIFSKVTFSCGNSPESATKSLNFESFFRPFSFVLCN